MPLKPINDRVQHPALIRIGSSKQQRGTIGGWREGPLTQQGGHFLLANRTRPDTANGSYSKYLPTLPYLTKGRTIKLPSCQLPGGSR